MMTILLIIFWLSVAVALYNERKRKAEVARSMAAAAERRRALAELTDNLVKQGEREAAERCAARQRAKGA